MGQEPAISLQKVSVRLGGVSILEEVDATVERGSLTALIGPNGAGKTTLLMALLGLVPYTGTIRFGTGKRSNGHPRIGYVPQHLDLDRGAPITVLDLMVMSMQRRPLWFFWQAELKKKAEENLGRVQSAHLIKKPIGKLSGGEFQRVLLALALQQEPDILLLDEPVSGVDMAGELLFCDLLEEIQREARFTLVMVSHDLSIVTRHADHVICLNRKVQCQGTAPEVLTPDNIQAIYGVHAGIYDHHDPQSHQTPAGDSGRSNDARH